MEIERELEKKAEEKKKKTRKERWKMVDERKKLKGRR